jgi:hypothetical protein
VSRPTRFEEVSAPRTQMINNSSEMRDRKNSKTQDEYREPAFAKAPARQARTRTTKNMSMMKRSGYFGRRGGAFVAAAGTLCGQSKSIQVNRAKKQGVGEGVRATASRAHSVCFGKSDRAQVGSAKFGQIRPKT